MGKLPIRALWVITVSVVVALLLAIIWQRQLTARHGPTWRGLVVGTSTEQDVVKVLGQPEDIDSVPFGAIYLFQESRNLYSAHRVKIISNVVQSIEETTYIYQPPMLLPDLVAVYGTPNFVDWSPDSLSGRAVVYEPLGIIVTVMVGPYKEAQVTRILYYVPRSRLRLYVDFPDQLRPIDPFPNSDVIGPKDPWFGTSDECRPACNP
jgi:hypothetical protein